jgi:hypothetical protein
LLFLQGAIMQLTRPTKEQVRAWTTARAESKIKTPPPSIEEIRRQLGWYLKPA